MKSYLRFLAVFMVFFLIFQTVPIHAEVIQPKLIIDSNDSPVQGFEKIVFTLLKRNSFINKSEEKYAQEIEYYFFKKGFSGAPLAFALFPSGSVLNVNKNWQQQSFQNNLNRGVLWIALVYDGTFDLTSFDAAFKTLQESFLSAWLPYTAIKDSNSISAASFEIVNQNGKSLVNFTEKKDFDLSPVKEKVQFSTKKVPKLTISPSVITLSSEPRQISKANITVKNESDVNYIFSKENSLKFNFGKESPFFVNESWVNPSTPVVQIDSVVKAGEEKVFEIAFTAPLAPGKTEDILNFSVGNFSLGSAKVSIEVKDLGLKLLKIRRGQDYVIIKNEPSGTSQEIGRAPIGEVYEYTVQKNGYYEVKFKSKTGWIPARNVDILNKK